MTSNENKEKCNTKIKQSNENENGPLKKPSI